jgi:hypothetical protein
MLSGAPYTLNQIIPASALTITKGKDSLGKYTYKGDSGKGVHCVCSPYTRTASLPNLQFILTSNCVYGWLVI